MSNPRLVKAKLSQGGIHCTLDWVTAGMSWLAEEEPGLRLEQIVVRLQEQWTLTDISVPGVMDRAVLPANLASQVKVVLPGQYSLQVQHGHDIGSPAYGQLQKLHNVDLENARVSADDSQVSSSTFSLLLCHLEILCRPVSWEEAVTRRPRVSTTSPGSPGLRGASCSPSLTGSRPWRPWRLNRSPACRTSS